MQALIDPTFQVSYVSEWVEKNNKLEPVIATYPNSARVCEICLTSFEVCVPFFWVDCDTTIIADAFYYDTANSAFYPVVNAPMPESLVQTTIVGAQTI
jgi:hypothetical protein